MIKVSCRTVLLAVLIAISLTAADDPFLGKWKINQEKSKTSGLGLKIEDLGANKYRRTGGVSYEVIADGTDHPRPEGGTRSLTIVNATMWKSVIKRDGVVTSETVWNVSSDGSTMTTHTKGTNPDGSKMEASTVNTRTAGSGGFVGAWVSKAFKLSYQLMEFQSYAGGISLVTPALQTRLDVKFDGKDYKEQGPRADMATVTSGKRLASDAIQLLDKRDGKVVYTNEFRVSADGKTLTVSSKSANWPAPEILVFEKQ
jgi:hypothetical protein